MNLLVEQLIEDCSGHFRCFEILPDDCECNLNTQESMDTFNPHHKHVKVSKEMIRITLQTHMVE